MTKDLHDIYEHMTSLAYRVQRSQDRVDAIRVIVAREQFNAARHLPRSRGRGPRERAMGYWDGHWTAAEAGTYVKG